MSFYEKLKTSKNPNNILICETIDKSLEGIERELKEKLLEKLSENFLKISKKVKLKENFSEKRIEGFEGPYINQYLKGMCPTEGGNKFKKLEEAIKYANKNSYCSGVTLTRQGYFTLRMGTELKESDINKKFKSKEISWIKKESEKVFEESKKKNKSDETYEIIKYDNEDYYYNIITRIAIHKESNKKFIMENGKLKSI